MGFRSRALLTGAATGFLKSNNDRRDRMSQRMQELAEENATIARERAKSRYEAEAQQAQAITAQQAQLFSDNLIDAEGNYTDLYYDQQIELEWKDPEVRKSYENRGGLAGFAQNYKKMNKEKKFINPYKSPEEIQRDLTKTYASIANKQKVEMGQPVLTGLDRMLGRGIASGINMVGEGVNKLTGGAIDIRGATEPAAPREVPEVSEFSARKPQEVQPVQASADEPYVPVDFKEQEEVKLQTAQQIIQQVDGSMVAVFASNRGEGEVTTVPLGVSSPLPEKPTKSRDTSAARLFDAEKGVYFASATMVDNDTGEILIEGKWQLPSANIQTMPANVQLQNLEYRDPTTGEEMKAQAYMTSGSATGPNIVRQPDGTTWALTGLPVLLRGKRDVNDPPKSSIPEVVKKSITDFSQQRKTASLASTLLKRDFVSSPTSWVQANLSVFTDMVGASVGLVGDKRPEDLQAIADVINSEIREDGELADAIGLLDAKAVLAGEKDALQNFLVYSLARSQFGAGRLNVNAIKSAEKVVKPLMSGSEFNRGALTTVIARSGEVMGQIAGRDITLALGQGKDSKIWEYYPRVKQKVFPSDTSKALTPIQEKVDGELLLTKINKLSGTAKEKTINNLVDTFGPKWKEKLTKPIRFSSKYDTIIMPFYKVSDDGSIRFAVHAAK